MSSIDEKIQLSNVIAELLVEGMVAGGSSRKDSESLGNFVFDVIMDGLDLKGDSEIQATLTLISLMRQEDLQ